MTLMMITQRDFLNMLAKNPDISVSLLEGLARAVRRMDRSLAG
jgi:CRP-like cAMP-binding protein